MTQPEEDKHTSEINLYHLWKSCLLQRKETPNRLILRPNLSSLSRHDGCPVGAKEVIPASSERGTPAPPKEASILFRYSRIISRCRSMPTRNHPYLF